MNNLEKKENNKFVIKSKFKPSGDQPEAIKKIVKNLILPYPNYQIAHNKFPLDKKYTKDH